MTENFKHLHWNLFYETYSLIIIHSVYEKRTIKSSISYFINLSNLYKSILKLLFSVRLVTQITHYVNHIYDLTSFDYHRDNQSYFWILKRFYLVENKKSCKQINSKWSQVMGICIRIIFFRSCLSSEQGNVLTMIELLRKFYLLFISLKT